MTLQSNSRKQSRRLNRGGLLVFSALVSFPLQAQTTPIVISQIYGGGGNVQATLRNDFVELLNRGSVPVDITGWTIQYASASGSSWDRTTLTGTIQPGQYYLVEESRGTAGTQALPTADAIGGIAMSATSGKVALVRNAVILVGTSPINAEIVDFVGYGQVNYSLGQPAPLLTNTTAAIRRNGGCTNTANNASDFTAGSPTPHNRLSPANLCGLPPPVDTSTPAVSISQPRDGATVSGSAVTLAANATDNVGVAGVQFLLDSVPIGPEDSTAPYSITWDSTSVSNGMHRMAATARDAAGNRSTSPPIQILVQNQASPPPPAITSFSVDPAVIEHGQAATLRWSAENATSVSIDNGIGSVSPAGSRQVSPSATTTYRLSVIGVGGELSRTVTLRVNETPVQSILPEISSAGVVNAASLRPGPIAAGELILISGSNLGPQQRTPMTITSDGRSITKSLAGTRVLFDGNPAPIIFSSSTAVEVVAPFRLADRSSTELQLEYNGNLSNPITLAVAQASPGIFTQDTSGRDQALVFNQDRRANGPNAPAEKGTVITVYATGGGQTTPHSEDGQITSGSQIFTVPRCALAIGSIPAEIVFCGSAPFAVSGLLQITARIPGNLTIGGALPLELTIGAFTSQRGPFLVVTGEGSSGSGPLIDSQFSKLQNLAIPPALDEIPHDRIAIPKDWLALISWNIQIGGTSATSTIRPLMVKDALFQLFGGSYQILAAQEIPNAESADVLRALLPGGQVAWQTSFFDTTDSMDNGFWYSRDVRLRDAFPLFVSGLRDPSGRYVADESKSQHPPQVAQFEVGDFDFTLVTLHLTFAEGDTAESARELAHVLEYLDWYFNQPNHDPDVVVCGDFNIPSRLSGQTGQRGVTLDAVFAQDSRFQVGERRFVVTVHQPTSRSPAANGGAPARNYDHCVLSADTMEEFIQARRVDTDILTAHSDDPEQRLTSDHFPIAAFFRTRGPGISLDNRTTIRPIQ